MKKCRQCSSEFKTYNSLAIVCSLECSLKYNSEKEVKKRVKVMKRELTTYSDYMNVLQKVFNQFIRLRDRDEPCISCDCKTANKWDAGHFWATTYSFLRFNEDNVHKQCSNYCNVHKSGNHGEYRIRLIKKIGAERVQWLDDNRHKELNLSIPEIKELIEHYKTKIKELK